MDVCFLSDGSTVCRQSLNDIGDILDEVLRIGDGESSEMPVNVDPPKCLNKSVTFPLTGAAKLPCSSSPQDDEMLESASRQLLLGECTSDVYTRSYSFPSALKPPSAMKGSREKRGASIGKLTVTWAPDVYDPPPTSASHSLSRGSKQRMAKKDKKNGKKLRKGKDSSRAGDSKKKKHHRRSSVSSSGTGTSRRHDQPNGDFPHDIVPLGTNRFEIGGKETCGSSYLMNSLTGVHYSATEAL
ncbi:hypothetical protein MLD38_020271 [Melastoma candidum]|uniref:Uncharacterized protein n=1 Tax=Melastoma candidum TaxID=119954 RepID=A0ACB9QCT6_9MYRT|nr:hypothetical protein MLD38_020271 [Melastoma candidum]